MSEYIWLIQYILVCVCVCLCVCIYKCVIMEVAEKSPAFSFGKTENMLFQCTH